MSLRQLVAFLRDSHAAYHGLLQPIRVEQLPSLQSVELQEAIAVADEAVASSSLSEVVAAAAEVVGEDAAPGHLAVLEHVRVVTCAAMDAGEVPSIHGKTPTSAFGCLLSIPPTTTTTTTRTRTTSKASLTTTTWLCMHNSNAREARLQPRFILEQPKVSINVSFPHLYRAAPHGSVSFTRFLYIKQPHPALPPALHASFLICDSFFVNRML